MRIMRDMRDTSWPRFLCNVSHEATLCFSLLLKSNALMEMFSQSAMYFDPESADFVNRVICFLGVQGLEGLVRPVI